MHSFDKTIVSIAESTAEKVIAERFSNLEKLLNELPDALAERMKTPYTPNDILTTTQVAEYLGLSPQTVTNWRQRGINLTYHLQGEKARYLFSDVLAFKQSLLGKKITPKR